MVNISLVLLFAALKIVFGFRVKFFAILVSRVYFYIPFIILGIVPEVGQVSRDVCSTTLSLNYGR